MKVLIIDDDPDTAKTLQKRMSSIGLETAVASDAYYGTAFINKEKPDLVLLDLMMPAGGGISVLKNMKLSDRTKNIPVIVLTAIGSDDYKQQAMSLGANVYMDKPYNAEELTKTVKKLLGMTGE